MTGAVTLVRAALEEDTSELEVVDMVSREEGGRESCVYAGRSVRRRWGPRVLLYTMLRERER